MKTTASAKSATSKTASRKTPTEKATPDDATLEKSTPDLDSTDITQVLHHDHQHVAELFFQYSELEEDDLDTKNEIATTIVKELFVHAKVEEEIVYPAVRKSDKESEDMMDEADTEHHVVKFLLSEISEMKAGDDHFDSKICVLAELVNHHVQEEEKDIFDELRDGKIDLEKMGAQVLARKGELEEAGIPSGPEILTGPKTSSKKKK